MAEQDDLDAFANALSSEIRDRAVGDSAGAEFRENAFVEIVADHLTEIGMLANPQICYHEGRVGNGIVRLNGYDAAEEGDHVDLLVALFRDETSPKSVVNSHPHGAIPFAAEWSQ